MKERENNVEDYKKFALKFVQALSNRQYAFAYSMASEQFADSTSLDKMKSGFESMLSIYNDEKIKNIEIVDPEGIWLGKQPEDIYLYVSVSGDEFVEAVTVLVTKKDDQFKIQEIEFGRP